MAYYGGIQQYYQQHQAQQAAQNVYQQQAQQTAQNIYQQHAWQAMQFNSEEEFRRVFDSHKSQAYNAIQAEELLHIMNTTPRIRDHYRISWSLELCKIMIAMLDRSRDGLMQYEEFRELLQCLVYWYQTFKQYDVDGSNFMEAAELHGCIRHKLNYVISAKAMETILKRYSRVMDDGRCLVAFDDFVSCCVRLRAYTEAFRARDRTCHGNQETGQCVFQYDDFLQCVMCL